MPGAITAYFFSGLGADRRAFKKIKLPDGFEIKFIDWISPLNNESLLDYSLRMAKKVDTTKPFILIGLSFGGIVISELTLRLHPLKSIIISSASTSNEIPWYFRLLGRIRFNKIVPIALLKSANPLTLWFFGTQSTEENILLAQVLRETDNRYLRWAISAIINWPKKNPPVNMVHIHGTKDMILPIRFINNCIPVKGGGHFMVLSMPETINRILGEELGYL